MPAGLLDSAAAVFIRVNDILRDSGREFNTDCFPRARRVREETLGKV